MGFGTKLRRFNQQGNFKMSSSDRRTRRSSSLEEVAKNWRDLVGKHKSLCLNRRVVALVKSKSRGLTWTKRSYPGPGTLHPVPPASCLVDGTLETSKAEQIGEIEA